MDNYGQSHEQHPDLPVPEVQPTPAAGIVAPHVAPLADQAETVTEVSSDGLAAEPEHVAVEPVAAEPAAALPEPVAADSDRPTAMITPSANGAVGSVGAAIAAANSMPVSEAAPSTTPEPAEAAAPPVITATQPSNLMAALPATGMRVIALANQKGGVAKTTTTLNLAVAFSEMGYRVLCIDMDPQGNLTMSQGMDPDQITNSMYNVLLGQSPIRAIIHKREVDVAVSSIDLAGAELAMASMIGRERSLQKALAEVREDYDFVFIDTPPSLGLLTINALTAAHRVIVPVQCEYLSMRGLLQLQNTLSMIQEHLNPEIQIQGILPTMLDTRTLHAQEAIDLLEENFAGRVFRSRISRTVRFAEAPVKGMSVLKYEPEGSAAKCYRDLAKEIMESV